MTFKSWKIALFFEEYMYYIKFTKYIISIQNDIIHDLLDLLQHTVPITFQDNFFELGK